MICPGLRVSSPPDLVGGHRVGQTLRGNPARVLSQSVWGLVVESQLRVCCDDAVTLRSFGEAMGPVGIHGLKFGPVYGVVASDCVDSQGGKRCSMDDVVSKLALWKFFEVAPCRKRTTYY